MEHPIIIWGASILGEVVLQLMEASGTKPVCFGDNDKRKQEKPFHGYPVIGLEEARSKYPDAVIIIGAGRYYTEIYDQLYNVGYRQIYRDTDYIAGIDFAHMPHAQIKNITWRLAQLDPSDTLRLDRLNIIVTERCTLRCQDCSSSMFLYREPKDCDTSLLLRSVEKILDCVDYIHRIEVLGGEPFLNKDLPLIISKLATYDKILQIDVVTNGTILPPDDTLDCLKHDNICVIVNDYKVNANKKDALLKKLDEMGIKNRESRHWKWALLGSFGLRARSERDLAQLFQKCNFSTCTELLHGELHRCPRSSHGMNAGIIPRVYDDYIKVCESPNLKEQIHNSFKGKKFISACNYCDGNTSDTLILEPALQL